MIPNTPPPVLPSNFYGEIHFNNDGPMSGDKVNIFLTGAGSPLVTTPIINAGSNLIYLVDVPGDIAGTAEKEGGTEGEALTFMINGRVVATHTWHGGTSFALNLHPPEAVPGGPYAGDEGSVISFSGLADDWGDDADTYEWDLDNNGIYEATGQNASRTWTQDGTYPVGLKVTDAQDGIGTATFDVTVNNVPPTVDAGDPYTGDEDVAVSFTGTATDPGADTLTYEWDFDYDGVTFNADASGSLNASHAYAVPGTYTVALRVHDDDTFTIDTASVIISNVNDVPLITGQHSLATDEDTPLTITLNDLTVEDPDNIYPGDFTLTVLAGTNYTFIDNAITPALKFQWHTDGSGESQ